MKLAGAIASFLITVSSFMLPAYAQLSIRSIDFNNFTYTLRPGGMGPSGMIPLTQGEYRHGRSSVRLGSVRYADLNGDGIEDVLVTLRSSGGGSGVSTHAFGLTSRNGNVEEILYRMNFIDITPQTEGFTLIKASPLSTGTQDCPDFFVRSNALDIETYEWNSSEFVRTNLVTVFNNQVCDYF